MNLAEMYRIFALLLTYPEAEWYGGELAEASDFVEESATDVQGSETLRGAIRTVCQLPIAELARIYVDTFDFDENKALYLTAHEFGDKRERGTALVQLRQMLMRAGYMEIEGELPDFIPLLLEFLAEQPEAGREWKLHARLHRACHSMMRHLQTDNPYQPVFAALLEVLPNESVETLPEARSLIEEEVPYPITYE